MYAIRSYYEEVLRDLSRRGVHQPRADLRELAADARLDRIAQHGFLAVGLELHLGAAFAEARDAALAFEGDRIRARRLEVGQRELALELRVV